MVQSDISSIVAHRVNHGGKIEFRVCLKSVWVSADDVQPHEALRTKFWIKHLAKIVGGNKKRRPKRKRTRISSRDITIIESDSDDQNNGPYRRASPGRALSPTQNPRSCSPCSSTPTHHASSRPQRTPPPTTSKLSKPKALGNRKRPRLEGQILKAQDITMIESDSDGAQDNGPIQPAFPARSLSPPKNPRSRSPS